MDNKTILIVDDESIVARVLKRLLERHFPDITVCCITDPQKQSFKGAVIDLVRAAKVDLIITDLELEHTFESETEDGRRLTTTRFEFGYEIIADLVDQIPCMVMSGNNKALDFQDPLARFAHLRPKIKAFFHKPLPPEDALIAAVRSALFPPEAPSVSPPL